MRIQIDNVDGKIERYEEVLERFDLERVDNYCFIRLGSLDDLMTLVDLLGKSIIIDADANGEKGIMIYDSYIE